MIAKVIFSRQEFLNNEKEASEASFKYKDNGAS
jgi:hypothetical protein